MPLEMKYFVLKPRSKHGCDIYALASRRAMELYATTIEDVDMLLARSLRSWIDREARVAAALREEMKDETKRP